MEAGVGSLQPREVEREHLDPGQRLSQRLDAGIVGPVAPADEERAFVEPHRVAALGRRRLRHLERDRHADRREILRDRRGLDAPAHLAGPQHHRAAIGRDRRVADVHRVGVTGDVAAREQDLGTGVGEDPAEHLVLLGRERGLGFGEPAELTPSAEVDRARRSNEHAAQRRDLRLPPEGPFLGRRHVSPASERSELIEQRRLHGRSVRRPHRRPALRDRGTGCVRRRW